MTMETGLGDHATAGYNRRMSIEDLLAEVTRLYRTNGLTGIQPCDGSGMSGTGFKVGSRIVYCLYMLARTVVERF